ncbi:SDR family oxidoreductase [Agaribacterium haliotis]|uniref:SDR family oxidoreductase n=1 Tax=Agaribacterium haliotis TaxID=2013869 RepID=UPI000BB57F24|nr:SDR family oxidoreductase [Agaribacterium haliotis]
MKTVVISGANRGIGLALAQCYKNRGDRVIALVRRSSEELKHCADRIIEDVDLADEASFSAVAETLSATAIDVLINNAGVLFSESIDEVFSASMLEQYTINALAPIRLSSALKPSLNGGAKIACITSRMGSIADNGSGAYYGYRMSKAALNAGAKSLALDLKGQNVAVALLHPGFVQTEMVNYAGDIDAQTAAERLSKRIDELTIHNSGSFWHSNGEQLPW